MNTLSCPRCGELMHKTAKVTPKTREIGLTQLAHHQFAEHTLVQIEALLEYTSGLITSGRVDLAGLKRVTAPICPGCKDEVTEDSYRYVQLGNNKTSLCCSQRCLDQVLSK